MMELLPTLQDLQVYQVCKPLLLKECDCVTDMTTFSTFKVGTKQTLNLCYLLTTCSHSNSLAGKLIYYDRQSVLSGDTDLRLLPHILRRGPIHLDATTKRGYYYLSLLTISALYRWNIPTDAYVVLMRHTILLGLRLDRVICELPIPFRLRCCYSFQSL